MRNAAGTVLLWAVLLGVLTVVLVGFDAGSDLGGGATPALAVALLGTAALTMALLAAGLALGWRRRREPRPAEEAVPDLSMPTVVVALGLGGALVGAEVGVFLVLIGAGVTLLGLGALAADLLSARRALEGAGAGDRSEEGNAGTVPTRGSYATPKQDGGGGGAGEP